MPIRSSCRKRYYKKLRDARNTRDFVQGKTGVKLYIYKCSHCKKYHLTKKADGPNRIIT